MTIREYLTQRYKKRTSEDILRFVNWFRQELEEEGLDIVDVGYNDIFHVLTKTAVSPQTNNNKVRMSGIYFDYLISSGVVELNPVLGMKFKGVHKAVLKFLTAEELVNCYESYISRDFVNEQDKIHHLKYTVLLGLLVFQGLRLKELEQLSIEDFDLQKGVVTIQGTDRANRRTLLLDSRQVLSLYRYVEDGSGYLFTEGVSGMIGRVVKHLNRQQVENVTAQQLRSSRISVWLKEVNVREVQYLTGFKYLSSLEKYRNQDIEELRSKVEQYHPLG